jgi:uncharacterized protein (TIGR00255 family)
MTGFGRGEADVDGFTARVELRSVNNRYCEVTTRLPRYLADREADIQKLLKAEFSRGRINAQIVVEFPAEDASILAVDVEAARTQFALLDALRSATGITEPITLDHLLRNSDLLKPPEEVESVAEKAWIAVGEALKAASSELRRMRLQEGAALETELAERIDAIEERLREVEEEAPKRVPAAGDKLRERLREILDDDRIDKERLEFELVLLADRLDVREECVRLRSHLDQFRAALAGAEPVGRKLTFLSQEMNREINTIGSKANDAGLSHLVVDMKEDLEKIREQVENVE